MGLCTSRMSTGPPAHRSIRCGEPTFVRFNNESDMLAAVYWIDYAGKRRCYTILYPGETIVQATYLTHPWMVWFVDKSSGTLRLIDGSSETVAAFKVKNKSGGARYQTVFYPLNLKGAAENIMDYVSVSIVALPRVSWNISTHGEMFPESFKNQTRTLLMCHHSRGRRQCSISPSSERTPDLGNIPQDVILHILSFLAPTTLMEYSKPEPPDGSLPGDYSKSETDDLFR